MIFCKKRVCYAMGKGINHDGVSIALSLISSLFLFFNNAITISTEVLPRLNSIKPIDQSYQASALAALVLSS